MPDGTTYIEQHREALEAVLESAISDLALARPPDPIAFVARRIREINPADRAHRTVAQAAVAQAEVYVAQGEPKEGADASTLWNATDWLAADAAQIIAEALLRPLKQTGATPSGASQFEFLRMLGRESQQSLEPAVHALLLDADLSLMAERIARGVQRMCSSFASTGSEASLNSKFVDSRVMSRSLAEVSSFGGFEGFESVWGPPRLQGLMEAMRAEHCECEDSYDYFSTPSGLTTMPQVEWHFVVAPEDPARIGLTAWPVEDPIRIQQDKQRKPMPMEDLLQIGSELSERLKPAALRPEELIAARLFTGPLHVKYGVALAAKFGSAYEKARGEQLLKGNTYATSLHLINSAILKLSRLGTLQPIYRAAGRDSMSKLSEADHLGECGTLEFAFLHTSADRFALVEYMKGVGAVHDRPGQHSMIFEIVQDAEHRGANLSAISQYPAQREIVFPPLSCLVLQRTRVESMAAETGDYPSGLLVAEMRVRSTAGAEVLDIEQYIERAKLQFSTSCAQTVQEFRSGLPEPDEAVRIFHGLLPEQSGLRAHPPEWFNDPDNWAQATRTLSEARSAVWSKFTLRFFEVNVGGQLVRLRDLAHSYLRDERLAGGEMEKFTGSTLVLGRPVDAALGLSKYLKLADEKDLWRGMGEGVSAIEREFATHGTEADKECLTYVLHAAAGSSSREWPHSGNRVMDKFEDGVADDGRMGQTLEWFVNHEISREASLLREHVVALRLYTTAAYRSLNDPLVSTPTSIPGLSQPPPLPTRYRLSPSIVLCGVHSAAGGNGRARHTPSP